MGSGSIVGVSMFGDVVIAANTMPGCSHECVVFSDSVWYLVEFLEDGEVITTIV